MFLCVIECKYILVGCEIIRNVGLTYQLYITSFCIYTCLDQWKYTRNSFHKSLYLVFDMVSKPRAWI